MPLDPAVAEQIEKAFDYRGHVTVTLADGKTLEGYLFNRDLEPFAGGEPFVELIRKDSEERVRVPAAQVRAVALTGKDFAVPFTPPAR